ncbi:MAG: hypothetical protein HZA52_14135 [Planctomycetes bacterium]|nr:hypothetical protein [Planctomycetota bacterium]
MDLNPEQRREGGEEYPGARWLRGESPREILDKLLAARALEIESRVAARLDSRAVLLDPERTYLRVLAHTARKAFFYRGDPPLGAFLEACIDRGIDDLVDEDVEAERSGAKLDAADTRYQLIAQSLGIDAWKARRVCVVLNTSHDELRHAVFALLVQRKTLHRYVAEGHGPPQRVRELVREGLRRLSLAFGRDIDPREYGL